jgi:hypothetical protein
MMDLQTIRERWVNYNLNLLNRFTDSNKVSQQNLEKLRFFATTYLIDFESELDEDPENEDGGILTLDTITAGYIDSFLGRWYIQNNPDLTEDELTGFMDVLAEFYAFLKQNKLYKERAAFHTQLMSRLNNKKKYLKRLKEYQKIQLEKDRDDEKYLDLMQEWEYEDII